jgi:hypothetical protein
MPLMIVLTRCAGRPVTNTVGWSCLVRERHAVMPTDPPAAGPAPKVFVSYAHDSPEHRDQVRAFASFLRGQGVEAVLDTWAAAGQRRDWSSWAIKEMTGADFVVVIASHAYRLVGDGCGPPGIHRGAQSEAALLRDLVHGDRDHWLPKILPVLLAGHGIDEIPLFLQPHTASRYPVPTLTANAAADLLEVIRRQPEQVAPPVATQPPELPSPPGWGEFDRLPDRIQALLRAQGITAADLPYRLRGARSHSLATVYVRQELGTGTDAPRPELPRTEPYRDGKVPVSLPEPPTVRLVVRPPARPIRTALDADAHLLVTGGPGQGKSTLSLRLPADIIAAWISAPPDDTAPLADPVIPLRLTARELAARRDLPFEQALAECVRAEYGALLTGEVGAGLLAGKVAGRQWLLLIDGLDEVADIDDRDRLVRVLATKASGSDGSAYRILLTTRPIEGAALAPFQRARAARYELQPFDEDALRDFAKNWFAEEGPEAADRFVRQIRQAHLDDLVRVPLLATIAAIIFTEYRDVPLPDNQYELYQAYLEFLRSGRPAGGPFEELRTPLLEHLGRVRLETDAALVSEAFAWYTQRVPMEDRPPNWRDDLMIFLAAVGPLAMRGEELRFLHHSFAEHLAATSMARDLPPELAEDHPAFTHLLYSARDEIRGRYPRTVLLHYTRLRPDQADRLVRLLHAGTGDDHLLAARLLAKHAPASAGVFDEFLATARAWAMSDRHPGRSILAEVTRAAHHPGLVSWLVELSTNEDAPRPSRIVAAGALGSRPDEQQAGTAADLLEAVVRNPDLPVTDRLDAAEALVDCGTGRRAAADHGLRLVLADPSTPVHRRRAATVVLAGLGPEARAYAVESLLATLDDPWTPVEHLVEAATALAEIGLEFHERCATVFRSVLGTTREWDGIRNAARGLAALGPQYVNEAADALIALAGNTASDDYFDRAQAAETLRELGPLFGVAAGDLVFSMLAEPATESYVRDMVAHTLARLGADYRAQAATLLRLRLDRAILRKESPHNLLEGLIELGPDYHEEAAREIRRAIEDPLADVSTRITDLGRLAKLGHAHRAYAIERLRIMLLDRGIDVDDRIWVAHELVRLGPEFHPGVEEFLVGVVNRASPDHEQIPFACSQLMDLGVKHRGLAQRALVDRLNSSHLTPNSMNNTTNFFTELGPEYRNVAATLLMAMVTNSTRSGQQRMVAVRALVQLGCEYHRSAVDGLLDLLRQDGVELGIERDWSGLYSMGVRPRQELAYALLAQMSDPQAGPDRIVDLAKKIARLSDDHAAAAVEALEGVLADDTAMPWARLEAAAVLVDLRPERCAVIKAQVARVVQPEDVLSSLDYIISKLARMEYEALPLLKGVLADSNVMREVRESAAVLLPEFDPDLVDEAVAELRCQARDKYLDEQAHGEILMLLAELDGAAIDNALTFHRHILDDEEQPVSVRCNAAEQVVRLDRALWSDAAAFVRRILMDPFSTASDRLTAIRCLGGLNAIGTDEKLRLAHALIRDPALDAAERREAIDMLRGQMQLDAQRQQLADHRAGITDRIPEARIYGDPTPLPSETEAAIREVLTAPEFDAWDRVSAAVELAGLAYRLVPEAVEILTGIAKSNTAARYQALWQMAWLDGPARPTALSLARALVSDESLPSRTRRLAAHNLITTSYSTSPVAIDFLRAVAADDDLPDVCRIRAMVALQPVDGLGPLRAMRDDRRVGLWARVEAAAGLIAFTADDRAAAADFLGRIGADRTLHPGLRLRAITNLASLGNPRRGQAMGILTRILGNGTLSTTARALTAGHLADICPARRPQVIRVLREIQDTTNPLHRIRVLAELGALSPEEATPLLRTMAEDRALRPVARLRAAEKLANLRLDQCEPAALVARELMRDERVPWHVRRHAACDLARWSLVCREEARDMIRHIDATYRRRG